MRDMPECMIQRYKKLDELIQELNTVSDKGDGRDNGCANPGIKMMCDFWRILKEEPSCDLASLVKSRMCPEKAATTVSPYRFLHNISCYNVQDGKKTESGTSEKEGGYCISQDIDSSKQDEKKSGDANLSEILCNLKEAATFDQKCWKRLQGLNEAETKLQQQIATLEQREKEGVELLKQADCMWSCMEEAYQEKIAESLERQNGLGAQLGQVEASVAKWRKSKKELESQLESIEKARREVNQKITNKTNDIKSLNVEIEGYKKRIDANKKATEGVKKSIEPLKKSSDARVERIAAERKRLESEIAKERKIKAEKDAEGALYIKEAREDLQKICKSVLQKRLEKEDLFAEKTYLLQEIDLLKETCDLCKDKCKKKQETLGADINKLEAEIAAFRVQCKKCNASTDADEQRKLCSDCPRCAGIRECRVEGDICKNDPAEDCVCQMVKRKFLNNVFENMYTVLERQTECQPGKAVADEVLITLKNSRNGKLNDGTRKILQEFILSTVKKNLNLTIVGGAVKTRCELDPQSYKQLLECLNKIKASNVPTSEKGTDSKKDPCQRWGGARECYCPKGPKECVCTKKAPPKRGHGPCPVGETDKGEKVVCPHKDGKVCGVDCSMHMPNKVGADTAKWKPDPCAGPSCPYSRNMRAAQCVLGPEALTDYKKTRPPHQISFPDLSGLHSEDKLKSKAHGQYWEGSTTVIKKSSYSLLDDSELILPKDQKMTCECDPTQPHTCGKDTKQLKTYAPTYQPANSSPNQYQPLAKRKPLTFNKKQQKVDQDANNISNNNVEEKSFSKDIKSMNKNNKIKSNMNRNATSQNILQLTETRSGTVLLYVENVLYEQFKRKLKSVSQLDVLLSKSKSGNFMLDSSSTKNMPNPKLHIKKTPGGEIYLLINRKISKYIQPPGPQQTSISKQDDVESSLALILNKKEWIQKPKTAKRYNLKNQTFSGYGRNINSSLSQKISSNLSLLNIKRLLQNMVINEPLNKTNFTNKLSEKDKQFMNECIKELENLSFAKNGTITLNVQGENGVSANIEAYVTRTLSGHIGIDIKNMNRIGVTADNLKERPISLTKTPSGKYSVFIGCNKRDRPYNTILRQTPSGEMLVVIVEPVLKPKIPVSLPMNESEHEVYRLKAKDTKQQVNDLPVLLKSTPSQNFILDVDKEYEKQFNDSFKVFTENYDQCYVPLRRTKSNAFLINFSKKCISDTDKNGLLIKSTSGTFRVLLSGETYDLIWKRMEHSNHRKSSAALEDLIKSFSLPCFSCKTSVTVLSTAANNKKESVVKTPNSNIKNLYQTSSGQYAVVLEKENKKAFLHNLKNYLADHSKSLDSLRKTNSGEIIIALDGMYKKNDLHGSMKITPSGNIYVMMNEHTLKDLIKPVKETSSKMTALESFHIIKKNRNPTNKTFMTHCTINSDGCLCSNECDCKQLLECTETINRKKVRGTLETYYGSRERSKSSYASYNLRVKSMRNFGRDNRNINNSNDSSTYKETSITSGSSIKLKERLNLFDLKKSKQEPKSYGSNYLKERPFKTNNERLINGNNGNVVRGKPVIGNQSNYLKENANTNKSRQKDSAVPNFQNTYNAYGNTMKSNKFERNKTLLYSRRNVEQCYKASQVYGRNSKLTSLKETRMKKEFSSDKLSSETLSSHFEFNWESMPLQLPSFLQLA